MFDTVKKIAGIFFGKKNYRHFRYVSELSVVEAEELLHVMMDEKIGELRKINFFKRLGEGTIRYDFTYLDFRVNESETKIIEIDTELLIRDDFLIVGAWNESRSDVYIKYNEAVEFMESLNVRRYDETHKKLIH